MTFDDKDKTVESWLNYDPNNHDLEAEQSTDSNKQLSNTLKTAKSEQGQKDTIMFAFVNIWVTMAELLAPLFATIAVKNSQAINPKFKKQSSRSDKSNTPSNSDN